MNIAQQVQDALARVTGLDSRMATLETSQAALTAENKALKEQLSTQTENIEHILSAEQSAHALTKDALAKANAKLADAEARATAAESKAATFEAEIKTAKEELENKPAEINRVATQLMTQGFSRLGLSAPIADKKEDKPGSAEGFAHLSGIDRAIAAQKAHYQKQ